LAVSAHAQSNITLFALVDLNVTQSKAGTQAGGGRLTAMNDGTVNGLNGSRWGVRASEDLGDGLRAGVHLESGVLADTGALAQGGRGFGRQAFVFLSSASAGELRLGRQYILEDSVMGQSNPFGNALVNNPGTSVTNMGRNLPLWLNAPRADNVVQYQTPSFGGATLAGQYAPGEGTADRFYGSRVAYAAGPLSAAVSYEWNKPRAGGSDTNKSLTLGANYNFGAAKLLGGYQSNKNLTTVSVNGAASGVSNLIVTGPISFTARDSSGYTLGVEVPLGLYLIGANYTAMKYESAAGQSQTMGKAALAARYALSKNSYLYAGASLATGDLKGYISQKRVLQAGMRTAF
jgi:predicted porin